MKIFLENVRTFDGRHTFPLKPITVLTGENSSGKTTLLGMISGIFSSFGFPLNPTFDDFPYALGSYDTIATYKGGRYGRATFFTIGYEIENEPEAVWGPARSVMARYRSDKGRVGLDSLTVNSQQMGTLEINVAGKSPQPNAATLKFSSELGNAELELDLATVEPEHHQIAGFGNALWEAIYRQTRDQVGQRLNDLYNNIFSLAFFAGRGDVVSVAPIRTRPQRIYSKAKQAFEASGDHVPFVLDRLFEGGNRRDREKIIKALEEFGQNSGLFESVSIKKLGKKATDPFQLMINVGGRPRNLIDVGYGVSQALPVVVQAVLEETGRLLLLQQPEVHLHPRAQAALGSFFAAMHGVGNRMLLIETHSDFILDRLRQEVASGAISAADLGILFLKRDGYETRVHPLSVDASGNIVDAPPSYREFFLGEELRLLSRIAD